MELLQIINSFVSCFMSENKQQNKERKLNVDLEKLCSHLMLLKENGEKKKVHRGYFECFLPT